MITVTTPAAADVLAERQRQVEVEGYDPEHDDAHACDEIAALACFYAMPQGARDWDASSTGYGLKLGSAILPHGWPEIPDGDRRRELVKAGALVLAEIERLDRSIGSPAPLQVTATTTLVGQILVMATLLEKSLRVVKNVEAEGSDEGEQLQDLIDQGEAAIATVLTEHAMQPITSLTTTKGTTMTAATITPPAPLSTWQGQGGIYIGIKATPDGKAFHVVAAIGTHELEDQQWGVYGKRITGADSYHDGRANTEAMAAAGSALAQKILALDIEGHTDWALPSQADGHLLATNAKHLMQQGDAYWLSTQCSANGAWSQNFGYGGQNTYGKACEFRAVPVRCIQIV